MKNLDIHPLIKNRLRYFIEHKKIPHIIFYGESGSGKRHILEFFIKEIYHYNKEKITQYVMCVNCAHSKGIRFFRDELKFFAKTNIQSKSGDFFKSIILLNADKLTTDAQSALRRCIEKFSHTTRFFIVVENKNKLLKPILSRFCDIYIPLPTINDCRQSLHLYNLENFKGNDLDKKREKWLIQKITNKKNYSTLKSCITFVIKLYEKGYHALNLLNFIKNNNIMSEPKKSYYLLHFDEIRKEFRSDKLLMFNILYFVFMRPDFNLENIQIM